MIDRERMRADLPAVVARTYLNTGTFGPLPRPAFDAVRHFTARAYAEGRIGGRAFEEWHALVDRTRAGFAGVLGCGAGDVALTHSTTDGVNVGIAGMTFAAGDEVITTDAEHPGLTEPLAVLARRDGVVVRVVGTGPDRDVAAAVAALTGERTRLVALSHVLWTTGETLPIRALADGLAGSGALLLVDGAQSVGAIPVDPDALGDDVYTVSGQKWLCGPSGTGAVWVRRSRLAELETPWPNYISEERGPELPAPRPWPDARRLDVGTITLGALAGIAAALDWRAELGWSASYEAALAGAGTLRALLADRPGVEVARVQTPSPLVSFRVAGREPAQLVEELETSGVLVRQIPSVGLIRASVGAWNDEADLERLVTAIG